jgi:hypothetical protein
MWEIPNSKPVQSESGRYWSRHSFLLAERRMRFVCIAVSAAIALTGCASAPTSSAPKTTWVRADGKRGAGDPVLLQQFEKDRAACQGELQKANPSGPAVAQNRTEASREVGADCMAAKGYVLVRADEAEAKGQELAAAAAENSRKDQIRPLWISKPATRGQTTWVLHPQIPC